MVLLETLVNFIGFFIGLFGLIQAWRSEKKNEELHKMLKSVTWDDLVVGSREIRKNIEKEFKPDVVFTPCKRGATIANLMFDVDENVPLYVGMRLDKRKPKPGSLKLGDWKIRVDTGKYTHYVPQALIKSNTNKKILILDDFAMSGDSLERLAGALVENGINRENIKTATLVCTQASLDVKKLPDYYWKKTDYLEFYFPWGKAV